MHQNEPHFGPLAELRCTEIADQVVPDEDRYDMPGAWQAAWDAACIALGGDPAEYRG